MTTSETAYMVMVLATFAVFSVSLLAATWRYERSRPAAKAQSEAQGQPAHA